MIFLVFTDPKGQAYPKEIMEAGKRFVDQIIARHLQQLEY